MFGSVCTCHTWHKRLCTKKKRSMAGETAICRTTAKKRKQDAAINFRIKNPLVSHDKIIEKFALDITVSAFRKACSRAKPKDSLNPTSAKAQPASEPTAPTPSKYPKGGLHDQAMAEASLQLVRNWKKHGVASATRTVRLPSSSSSWTSTPTGRAVTVTAVLCVEKQRNLQARQRGCALVCFRLRRVII